MPKSMRQRRSRLALLRLGRLTTSKVPQLLPRTNVSQSRRPLGGKDPKREQYKTAKAAYDASIETGTFSGRKATFDTPKDGVYKGKDVRQALFNAHLYGQPGKKVGHDELGKASNKKHPKEFRNEPNSSHRNTPPLPMMSGNGREYGMMPGHALGYQGLGPNPTATRLITREKGGVHEFAGVVSHPLPDGHHKGDNDHVQVIAT